MRVIQTHGLRFLSSLNRPKHFTGWPQTTRLYKHIFLSLLTCLTDRHVRMAHRAGAERISGQIWTGLRRALPHVLFATFSCHFSPDDSPQQILPILVFDAAFYGDFQVIGYFSTALPLATYPRPPFHLRRHQVYEAPRS